MAELPKETEMRSEGASNELGASQDEIDLLPLKQFFDIEKSSYKDDKDLQLILGYLQSKGVNSRDDMNITIRRAEMKLGAPQLGESRTGRLARYFVLDGKLNSTLKELQSYERN